MISRINKLHLKNGFLLCIMPELQYSVIIKCKVLISIKGRMKNKKIFICNLLRKTRYLHSLWFEVDVVMNNVLKGIELVISKFPLTFKIMQLIIELSYFLHG